MLFLYLHWNDLINLILCQSLGFYTSVNIGWSIGWTNPKETPEHYMSETKLFSAVHTSIGVMFVGITVMYMARKMTENKENWMSEVLRQQQLDVAAATEGYADDIAALFTYYMPKYKAIVMFVLLVVGGFIFIWGVVEDFDRTHAIDFVLSTLSGAGYLSIPLDSPKWLYVSVGLFTAVGVPITAIAVGKLFNLCFELTVTCVL
jgi:hypothetical protein